MWLYYYSGFELKNGEDTYAKDLQLQKGMGVVFYKNSTGREAFGIDPIQ